MIERRYGIQRNKRLDKNLLDSPFQIDQRSFWDILGYITYLLKHVNYYDLNNEVDGQWDEVLKSDPIILMVQIINEPMNKLNLMIQNNEGRLSGGAPIKIKVITTLIKWYDKVEFWHENLLNLGEPKLASKIKNILVDVLALQRTELVSFQNQLNSQSRTKSPTLKSSPIVPTPNASPLNLAKSLHTFHKVIIHIQEFTKDYLEKNIYQKNNLMPNNAMYVAFALLFKKAQGQINTLSQRHLDFYYSDILHQSLGKGKPTSTIVYFSLLPELEYSLVDKGAQLSAGKLFKSKTDIIFETEKPIVVYQMELLEMQTLLFQSNPYIKVGTNNPLISSISKNSLIENGKIASPASSWFVFGANKRTVSNTQIQPNTVANMGFIIGSPALILKEGHRFINLKFNMKSTEQPNNFWKLLNEIKTNRKITMNTVFSDVFEDGFNISYSSKKGWSPISEYTIEYNEEQNFFSILLILNSADPAIEKSAKIHHTLTWPSIKVELNEYAPNYLYSFFQGIELDSIGIDVQVKNMKNLTLYNNIGKMTLNKAFDIFGPIPEKSSFLMIGDPELFQKQIQSLELTFDWANTPDDFGGFETYYNGYSTPFNNDSFKIQFSALSNGFWLPTSTNDIPTFNLFNSINCLTPEGYSSIQIANTTTIKLTSFEELGISQNFNIPTPLTYDITSQSGFVKLTLSEPSTGFGADLYQKEFIDIATFNAKNKQQIPFPNKPYIPKVNGVSIDYTASDILLFSDELSKSTATENQAEFFHITPFGTRPIVTNQKIKKNTLLADYSAEGYLILGLSGIKQTTFISVYFDFLHSSTSTLINSNNLAWEYRYFNEWLPLEKENIVLDETNGFIKSGIVELNLPKPDNYSQTNGNTNGLYQLRISTPKDAVHFPQIKGVYLNAIKAVCTSVDPKVIGQTIPKGSITKLLDNYPDIKKVSQPRNSLNGKIIENGNHYYTRVSERLRHKARAVTIWDYERLILENFNEVQIVKCTNFDKNFKSVPGHIKVIVISSRWTNNERHYFNEDALSQMKSFLHKWTNPFVKIEVMNPTIEFLLVNCIVEFKPEDNGGYYINQLNDEISSFLSPISNSNTDIGGIGGTIVPTMVVSFIDNLPFIQSIKKLTIEHIIISGIDNFSLGVYQGAEEIKTTTPWAILTPMHSHRIISVLPNQKATNDLKVGIGNMQIGSDFILGKEEDQTSSALKFTSTETSEVLTDSIFVFKDKSQSHE